jgi:predicted PurR-regulated permease PerM
MLEPSHDLTRVTIGGLATACFYVIRPFLPATIWAVTLVIASWPMLLHVEAALGGKRGRAVVAMTLALLLVVALPLWMAISTILSHSQQIMSLVSSLQSFKLPDPPQWLGDIPVIGDTAVEQWQVIAAIDVTDAMKQITPYAGEITQWFVGTVGGLAGFFIELLLTIVIATVLYSSGEAAANWFTQFAHRLAGDRGRNAVILAGQAIRAVALGVVVTAIVQSIIGGVGLALAGVPQTGVLTGVMFMMCIAQLGPSPVLIPAVIWLFAVGDTLHGVTLTVFSVVAIGIDNFLRPILIRRGADLPMMLILVGVIGGLLCFGLVGLFLGPVVLAVTYTLLQAWVDEDRFTSA